MPGAITLADGRIIIVANGKPQGYCVDSFCDPLNGKVFVSASRLLGIPTDDVIITIQSSNQNFYGMYDYFEALAHIGGYQFRSFVKVPPNKTIHIYSNSPYVTAEMTVYEVVGSLNLNTVTWNNQPAIGNIITTFMPVNYTWSSFFTGTTGVFGLKMTNELPPANSTGTLFANRLYVDPTLHPYVT